jgi:hypothetical protein
MFRNHTTLALLALGAATILAGCPYATPEPQLMRGPRLDPVPLRIGVYFPPELRDFTYRHHTTDTAYVLGKPSVRLLKEALTFLFVEVVESPLPGSGSGLPAGLAGVIEPRIISAGFKFPSPGSPSFPSHVTYGFTLYSSRGEPVKSWEAAGRRREPLGNPLTPVSTVKRSFALAMQDAVLEFTSGFRDIPEVRRWLDKQGVR